MKLTTEAVQEFISIWKSEFGEELSFERAEAEASSLLSLFLLIAEWETTSKSQ